MLEEAVGRLLSDRVSRELLERAEQGESPSELWRELEESGFTRPHLPESAGGSGAGWLDASVILRAAGRWSVPLPLAETILASWLLDRAGLEVPGGPLTILPRTLAESEVREGRLAARVDRVPYASQAGHAVFVTGTSPDRAIGLIALAEAEIRRGENLARERRDEVRLSSVPILASAPAKLIPDPIRAYGAMIRSVQMAGALDNVLAQSVRYARERSQFGKPIGSFQAIQQSIAVLAGHAAAAGVAAEIGARAADRPGDDPRFEIAVAKIRCGTAAEQATAIAHQVHGAIGFTYEHGLHFSTRRLWSWRAEFGTDSEWARLLGGMALNAGAGGLWPLITNRTTA